MRLNQQGFSVGNLRQQVGNRDQNNIQSLANLPTALEIEYNNRATHLQLLNQNDRTNMETRPQSSGTNQEQNQNDINNINRMLQEWGSQNRIQDEILNIQRNIQNREPHQENSSMRGLRELLEIYGFQINQSQFANLQLIGKEIVEKVQYDRNAQFCFTLLTGVCLIPSFCYYGMAKNLFLENIVSDIYFCCIIFFNLLLLLTRYLLLRKYNFLLKMIEVEQYDDSQTILFLVAVRDLLGDKSIQKISRSEVQFCLQKAYKTNLIYFLNILNVLQFHLLWFSAFFIFYESIYSSKIYGSNSLSMIILLSYSSLVIYLFYTLFYGVVFIVTSVVLMAVGSFGVVGYLIYKFFYGILYSINFIGVKLCSCKNYFENQNQILPTLSQEALKAYADAYVHRNTRPIIYKASLCKDPLCPICLEEYVEEKSQLQQMICCKSAFHVKCIIGWAQEKKNCPNCRAEDIFLVKKKKKGMRMEQISGILRNIRNVINDSSPLTRGPRQQQQQPQQQLSNLATHLVPVAQSGENVNEVQVQQQQQQSPQRAISLELQLNQQNQQVEIQQQQIIDFQNYQPQMQMQSQYQPAQRIVDQTNQNDLPLDDNHMFHGHHRNNLNQIGLYDRGSVAIETPKQLSNKNSSISLESYSPINIPSRNRKSKQKNFSLSNKLQQNQVEGGIQENIEENNQQLSDQNIHSEKQIIENSSENNCSENNLSKNSQENNIKNNTNNENNV